MISPQYPSLLLHQHHSSSISFPSATNPQCSFHLRSPPLPVNSHHSTSTRSSFTTSASVLTTSTFLQRRKHEYLRPKKKQRRKSKNKEVSKKTQIEASKHTHRDGRDRQTDRQRERGLTTALKRVDFPTLGRPTIPALKLMVILEE